MKMLSYQYRKSHCGDKTVVRSSYLHNGISYTGKMSSLYWIGAQVVISQGINLAFSDILQFQHQEGSFVFLIKLTVNPCDEL